MDSANNADDSLPVVVMTCGIAGSGKTTFAQRLELDGYVRLSIDEQVWRQYGRYGVDYDAADYAALQGVAEQMVRKNLLELIGRGHNVVIDLSFARRVDRDDYKRLVDDAGARWRLVYLRVARDELRRRLADRALRFDANAAFAVDDDLLNAYLENFEAPDGEGEEIVDPGSGVWP